MEIIEEYTMWNKLHAHNKNRTLYYKFNIMQAIS